MQINIKEKYKSSSYRKTKQLIWINKLQIYRVWDRWHYRVSPVALCITHAEPELTARPWFRVLNSHQGQ